MSHVASATKSLSEQQIQRLQVACQKIAPSWPLDNWIAVNPWWRMHDQPLTEVSAKLKVLAGAKCTMPKSYFLSRWQRQISSAHLCQAIAESELTVELSDVVAHLSTTDSQHNFLAFSRLLDLQRNSQRQISWHDEIIHQISQTVASYALQMEQGETQQQTLYQYWWDHVIHDKGIGIVMAAPKLSKVFARLPRDPQQILAMTLTELDIAAGYQAEFAHAMLLDINGWASWAAHQQWLKTDIELDRDQLWQLLAIRMAWEWVLYRYITQQEADEHRALIHRWHQQFLVLPLLITHVKTQQELDWLWQRAAEIAYQQSLFATLRQRSNIESQTIATPVMQAAFCIDVRSEVYRRSLEAQHPHIETLGFAGFFGLPLSFSPTNNGYQRPQLPGLLSSSIEVRQNTPTRGFSRSLGQSWHTFSSSSVSMFNAVEASGWFYGLKMIKNTWFAGAPSHPVNDSLNSAQWQLYKEGQLLTTADKVTLAHGVLTAMGLTKKLAPVVLLVGHGSQSCNNHMQAALDCGACCGQTGEVNVRVLAALLNDTEVRLGLALQGLTIPGVTQFIAALHNTTTDDIALVANGDALSHEQQQWLQQASVQTRNERTSRLTTNANSSTSMLLQRSRDWAELRPEWGLANNASFIVAKRQHTRGCNLQGRSFLHDYDWQNDKGYRTLELILTAPMIVTHWINFQYYASVTDNNVYGSGDKTLHNVVAGHLGVFEGNGGDLRVGLPMQSLHNGQQWMHEPLRLSVVIDAPQDVIQTLIERHESVRQLVDNQWLYLYAWQPKNGQIQRLFQGVWHHA
jgi:uncharacterized protein YbcC (UPF0753/DUF2309 family)